jgi:UDP-galactopyranose mutase
MKAIIVGAGLSGSTAAFILKNKGFDVEIFEQRDHIAGNCFDYKKQKMFIHEYGPHTFHTNNKTTWDFINQFGEFKDYCHIVKGNTSEGCIPLPFNRASAEIVGDKSEEEIVDLVFKDYSEKMWGVDWEALPSSIKGRVPKIKDSYDACYHQDVYQGIPIEGYTSIVKNMLEGITVHTNVDSNIWRKYNSDLLVYTGKLDNFFQNCRGELGYRSLEIKIEEAARQSCFQMNECNKGKPYTRTIDYSFLNDQLLENGNTVISREYPCEHTPNNTAFYPKNFKSDRHTLKEYTTLAKKQTNVIFLGRLATYKYLDMDAAIGQSLCRLKPYCK